jgi:acetyl-CoA decarbonylase/synthase complex subunit gamma
VAALTGMQIYKSLPKTNCKECGFPTCMAFAMQVAAKQKALTDCKHIAEEAKNALADASAPPMKLVTIGAGDKKFVFGQETVMFRHEERFFHPTGIAIRIGATLADADVDKKLSEIEKAAFDRVGDRLGPALVAVEVDTVPDPAGRVKRVADRCPLPLVLLGVAPDKLAAASCAVAAARPLICRTTAATVDALADLAAKNRCPLAVGAESLEELADCTVKAKAKGLPFPERIRAKPCGGLPSRAGPRSRKISAHSGIQRS